MIEFTLEGDIKRASKLSKNIIFGRLKPAGKVTLLGCEYPVDTTDNELGRRMWHEMQINARSQAKTFVTKGLWRHEVVRWPFQVETQEDQMLLMMAW